MSKTDSSVERPFPHVTGVTTMDKRMKAVSIAEITKPKNGTTVIVDCWWATDANHENVFMFRGKSPQCNRDESIARRVSSHLGFPDVVLLPIAYVEVAE